ncbi:helix-turn-helix transcriptional regulator [Pseudoteredinibacter isoporae]|uniref:DNA-binding CsgD family transcriptional regulator n=1 Tax=Pseudoteredinibacter isoporae TaxID=570281 RepID=A0A7X0MZP6_9GAMM|nr:helix-turn-helix transcriptional regulator [Pseudoteredinibacter isoporae]MBB6523382.1 DNA-binding CsgD family transcriptional regulator [Pseudoteredinibacter isoporae]NHO88894.1 helix-turn-helix transcriptional regulator [Pseudoteredinibacter isoporae]NIB24398.1 helix-turn-helix transcriptional regulator [Pseudoteredinibacter isoporae]
MDFDFQSRLIGSLGSDDFSQQFYDFWVRLLLLDQCTAWELKPGQAPRTLVSARPNDPELIKRLCDLYSESMYQGDEQLQQLKSSDNGIVAQISTQTMDQGQYRRLFFEEADLQEKLFILSQCGESSYYINLYRCQGRDAFSQAELQRCQQAAPYATALLDKHQQLLPEDNSNIKLQQDKLEEFFRHHPAGLSPREASTCSLIVTGHSNEAIALKLEVSINTARTFRRRAYEKLQLSTQAELFALYLGSAT